MRSFSERAGITKPKTEFQIKSMDSELRNCLWNTLGFYWTKDPPSWQDYMSTEMRTFVVNLWDLFFKLPIDTTPVGFSGTYNHIRNYFFNATWYEVYNFIEFVANNYPDEDKNGRFVASSNFTLEREVIRLSFCWKTN